MHWSRSVFEWKKVKHAKILDSFTLYRQMLLLSLEEMKRLVYDQFLQLPQPTELTNLMTRYGNNSLPIIFFRKCIYYFLNESASTTNERRRYLINFIILASKFPRFWTSIRNRCRVNHEAILSSWIVTFSLLNKFNCVDIGLNQIEREYYDISFKELKELRRNSLVRLSCSDITNSIASAKTRASGVFILSIISWYTANKYLDQLIKKKVTLDLCRLCTDNTEDKTPTCTIFCRYYRICSIIQAKKVWHLTKHRTS